MLLRRRLALAAVPVAALVILGLPVRAQEGFKFKTGVELISVTATVTGRDGRFLSGLRKDDFKIYDNDSAQTITHFSSDRVPVSLGILLDASGSMADDKMASARRAITRFVTDLLDDEDELFFMEFNDRVVLRQDWTRDRRAVIRAVGNVNPVGGTAMYDAIAQALPVAAGGQHSKKALLVISDGNDSNSQIKVSELRQAIRESEVLVYALGIDGTGPGFDAIVAALTAETTDHVSDSRNRPAAAAVSIRLASDHLGRRLVERQGPRERRRAASDHRRHGRADRDHP